MKKCMKFLLAILVAMLLPADFPSEHTPERTVPAVESSLFCKTAQAAFWDGWFQAEPINIEFGDMYAGVSARGLEFTDKLQQSDGQRVAMVGFMAPPLTPTINFFVLTQEPMSICPFCSSDADWPADIVVVYLDEPVKALPFDRPIRVTGQLSLGTSVDAETGFVSLVRIQADALEAI